MTYSQEPKKHILVVDDDTVVRMLVQSYLATKGYSITVAASGKNALEIYQRCSDKRNKPPTYCPVDLILTDMGMTPMGGYELFNKLITINPKAKICVMSGELDRYAEKIKEMRKKGLKGVLPKPFVIDELEKLVKSALK